MNPIKIITALLLLILAAALSPLHLALHQQRRTASLWRWQLYTDPETAIPTICESSHPTNGPLACHATVHWRDAGTWLDLCAVAPPPSGSVRHGRSVSAFYPERYYQLRVACGFALQDLNFNIALPLLQTTIFR